MKRNGPMKAAKLTAAARAHAVICLIFELIEKGVRDPWHTEQKPWGIYFGGKDSLVVAVHKLVAATAMLAKIEEAQVSASEEHPEEVPLGEDDMKILLEWLAEGKSKS